MVSLVWNTCFWFGFLWEGRSPPPQHTHTKAEINWLLYHCVCWWIYFFLCNPFPDAQSFIGAGFMHVFPYYFTNLKTRILLPVFSIHTLTLLAITSHKAMSVSVLTLTTLWVSSRRVHQWHLLTSVLFGKSTRLLKWCHKI